MRLESRWAQFAGWLSHETGDTGQRDAWMERALRLAQEGGDRDMAALIRMRQSQWAVQTQDAKQAILFADAGLHGGATQQTRALCALKAAQGHALAGDADACERRLADAYALVEADSPPPPWAGYFRVTSTWHVRMEEARAWLWLRPSKAIAMYESALRDWPRDLLRDGGSHQARLALACAGAGEYDRARAEGRKALAIARTTKSTGTARELKQLAKALIAS
jgi:tetratricopeptide (TPR) repeat protein